MFINHSFIISNFFLPNRQKNTEQHKSYRKGVFSKSFSVPFHLPQILNNFFSHDFVFMIEKYFSANLVSRLCETCLRFYSKRNEPTCNFITHSLMGIRPEIKRYSQLVLKRNWNVVDYEDF